MKTDFFDGEWRSWVACHSRPAAILTAAFLMGFGSVTCPVRAQDPQTSEKEEKDPRAVDEERIRMTRLQIFLDDRDFNPGKIDGRWGEYTQKALERYLRAEGGGAQSFGDEPPVDLPVPIEGVRDPFTTYQITEEDQAKLGDLPKERAQQAQQKSLPYETLIEVLGEKFHADRDFLEDLNPDLDISKLSPGDAVKVPNVSKVFDLAEAEAKPEPPETPDENLRIEIDRAAMMLDLKKGEDLIASYPVTPGSTSNESPPGEWEVKSITWMPFFRWDKRMLEHGTRSDHAYNLPPGPNSPVGIVWMALNKEGIGIHGTAEPDTIGRTASHGCIRLSNWDAFDLGTRIAPGTPVQIR